MLSPAVAAPFPLRWGFTTKQDEAAPPVRLKQVHGCDIHRAQSDVQEGDGLWTQTPGEAIGVRVADCAPILLAGITNTGPWVAALHAGWRGATSGILRRGVAQFQALGGRPSELAWAVGPCIGPCHFEVGAEVLEAARQDPAWREALAEPRANGKWHFNLPGFLQAQAVDLGLSPEHDGSVPHCTLCEPQRFFSYRGGDTQGRQWGWIEILPK
ncbi:MAG: polyphenol oxidase family protein [Firmicutes bacterium]|nr:polyphenol oxidase family protein [Bacillota bacterium]